VKGNVQYLDAARLAVGRLVAISTTPGSHGLDSGKPGQINVRIRATGAREVIPCYLLLADEWKQRILLTKTGLEDSVSLANRGLGSSVPYVLSL
jgi:hypothetical protein